MQRLRVKLVTLLMGTKRMVGRAPRALLPVPRALLPVFALRRYSRGVVQCPVPAQTAIQQLLHGTGNFYPIAHLLLLKEMIVDHFAQSSPVRRTVTACLSGVVMGLSSSHPPAQPFS